MSLLAAYLRRQYKLLLLLAGFFVIFAAVFSCTACRRRR